jgi:uncharacterized protein YjiS (DUF1127 family)
METFQMQIQVLPMIAARPATNRTLFARWMRAITLHRERRSLRALDDHLLRDVGLTRSQALAEGQRPLWDAPAFWRT